MSNINIFDFDNESWEVLNKWFMNNIKLPYPNALTKKELAGDAFLTIKELNNWFVFARTEVLPIFLKLEPKDQTIEIFRELQLDIKRSNFLKTIDKNISKIFENNLHLDDVINVTIKNSNTSLHNNIN